jgi:tripartite-type tricarboxylate transporter receptor subunit TctC
MPHIRASKLIPLAVTSVERSTVLPDVPVMSDFVPGYEAGSWFGIGAPRGTSDDIVGKLNKAINTGLSDPKVTGRLAELGATPIPGSPSDFAKFINDETERYGRVIRLAGIKAD